MEEQEYPVRKMRNTRLIVARVITTILAIFFSLAFLPKLIGSYIEIFRGKPMFDGSWGGLVMEITFYFMMAGFIFSWIKPFTAGIILIIGSLVQMLPFLIIEGNMGSFIFGLPMLVSGILLIFSH